ncbi:uncharacterized mitochondrial protein AtMg00810-like [Quercus suber]|uniref:uncharacterized mitochondrial protein AtMg00810-like n=1 Tax=Quercus suber TaxID=58331 RepID=UPI0032E009B3
MATSDDVDVEVESESSSCFAEFSSWYQSSHTTIYLLLYVDDIIITGNDPSHISHLITAPSHAFELKDLGALSYFLGMQIVPTQFGLTLCQSKYAYILHRFHMENAKPTKTPSYSSTRLTPYTSSSIPDPSEYRSMVRALKYLTFTCPDLAFSVHHLCQFMQHPTTVHLEAAKHVLCYVKGTLHFGIHLSLVPLTLSPFSDVDWAGNPSDRKSTTGLLVFLGFNPVLWSSKKQSIVSHSSTKAEYCALASTAAELSLLRTLFMEFHLFLHHIPILWCDNISAIALASNPVFHFRTKHIEVGYHFVREKVLKRDLGIKFISIKDNYADIFTKPLPGPYFLFLRGKLLADSTSCLRGDAEITEDKPQAIATKQPNG